MIRVSGIRETITYVNTRSKDEIDKQKATVMDSLVANLREATPVDTGKARDGWYRTKKSIENDVEYIDRLNEGSSEQAPSHFVERTVLSHPGVQPDGVIVENK